MTDDWDKDMCCGYGAAMKWLHENRALLEEDGDMNMDKERGIGAGGSEGCSPNPELFGHSEPQTPSKDHDCPVSGLPHQGHAVAARQTKCSSSVSAPPIFLSVGIDIVEVARIESAIARHGQRFLERVFTARELGYALAKRRYAETLAGRFAAKEAFMKALGRRIPWRAVEVGSSGGIPFVTFGGEVFPGVSISHERSHAVAVFVAGGAIFSGDGGPQGEGAL